jgi:hypothetical protein
MARDIGPWSDLYSLGCMAYEMSTGALPFRDTVEPFALMLRHISEPIPPARELNPNVDPELSDWIETLLAKEPADRVGSAAAAWEALDELLYRRVGPRWRRESALPWRTGSHALPVGRFTSAFMDPAQLAERAKETTAPAASVATPPPELPGSHTPPSEVPDALPGPFTPPPGQAVVSAEIAALDPDGYVSVDLDALTPPRPGSEPDSTVLTPSPDIDVGRTPAAAGDGVAADTPAPPDEPVVAAPVEDDFITFEPSPEWAPERLAPPTSTPPAAQTAPSAAVEPARETRRRAPLVIGGAVVVAAATVAAAIVLSGGGEPGPSSPGSEQAAREPAVATTSSLSSGPLSIKVPVGWSASGGADAPEGLDLSGVVRATPPEGGAVVIGLAPSARTTHALLPPGVLADGGKAPARTEVKLGDVTAYRYAELQGGLTAFVAPTDRGVATVVCEPPISDDCERIASTLSVDGAEVLPLGPDEAFAGAVAKALRDLDRATTSGAQALRTANTPRGQSRSADRTRSRYAGVARTLGRFDAQPGDARSARTLERAVAAGATAYERLSGAARRSDRIAYNRAAGASRRARQDIVAALAGLTVAGYTGLEAPAAASIPPLERKPVRRTTSSPTTLGSPETSTPRSTATPAPRSSNPAPRATAAPPKAKPTPVPAKPTPVPIEGDS